MHAYVAGADSVHVGVCFLPERGHQSRFHNIRH